MKAKDYVIKNILMEISEKTEGLTLLTNPAGSGKSYEVSHWIAEKIETSKRPIYYVTPRIKNLEELEEDVKEALGKGNPNIDKIMKIESFKDCVLRSKECLTNEVIGAWEETKDLVRMIKKYESTKDRDFKKKLEEELFIESGNYENRFRRRLGIEFRNDLKKYKEDGFKIKPYEYMKKSKWSFIEKLYPQCASEKKQVFFLSGTKFFSKNDPVIRESYEFTDPTKIKGAIVVIDEFDAIKENLLEMILQNGLKVHMLTLYKEIYYRLQQIDILDRDTLKIEDRLGVSCRTHLEKLREKSEKLKEKYFTQQFRIKFFIKDEESGVLKRVEDTERILSYKGIHAYPYVSGNKSYCYLPINKKNRYHDMFDINESCNKVLPWDVINGKFEDVHQVWYFINEIKNFVRTFLRKIYYIATDYQRHHNKKLKAARENDENLITTNAAISIVLSNLNFPDTEDYLRKMVTYTINAIENWEYNYSQKDNEYYDNSIYKNGLYYSCVYENQNTRDNSKLYNYELSRTPELMMLELCTNAHVIGISATAEVPSVKNFNLEFLETRLEKRKSGMYRLSKEQEDILKEDYERKTIGYKENKIETKVNIIKLDKEFGLDVAEDLVFLINGLYEKDMVMKLKENSEINSKCRMIKDLIEGKDKGYEYRNLYKIWVYLRDMMVMNREEKVLTNGIIVTNQGVKTSEDEIYTLENIKLGAAAIYMKLYNTTYKEAKKIVNKMFVYVNAEKLKKYKGDDVSLEEMIYSDELDHIRKSFKEERLIFMVTTYNSVGRGNNLQVEVGSSLVKKWIEEKKLFTVNSIFNNFDYLDWDSIYLENSSHVITNLNEFDKVTTHKDNLRALFTVEDICERDKVAVSRKTEILNDVFMAFNKKNRNYNYAILYGTQSVRNAYTTNTYQAIARIARTNVKKQYNAIFIDGDMVDFIETDECKLGLKRVTKEFEAFKDKIFREQAGFNSEYSKGMYKEFGSQNGRVIEAINKVLEEGERVGWSKDLRDFWEELRKVALKYPTISKEKLRELQKHFGKYKCVSRYRFDIRDCYFKFKVKKNKYYFNYKDGEILVSTDNRKNSRRSRLYPHAVSLRDSRLPMFNYDDDVISYFTEKEYDLEWKEEEYIMCPRMYQAIYKGALGEEILKAVLERKCGYKVVEIEDSKAYEKFDFLIEVKGKRIFIDAKNLSEATLYTDLANENLLKKLKKKIKYLEIDRCFIINIIDEMGDKVIVPRDNFIAVPGIYTVVSNKKCQLKFSVEIGKKNLEWTVLNEIEELIANMI